MIKRILALTVTVLLVFSCTFAVSVNAAETAADGLTLVAENGDYRLYADMESGDFAVYDLLADKWWHSGRKAVLDKNSEESVLNTGRIKTELVSLVSVNYVQLSTIASTAVPLYQNSYAYCVNGDGVKCKKINNGYRVEYYFSDIDTTVPLEITLNSKGISARIPGKDLKIGKDYRVISISLLPGFMAEQAKSDGYVFVPSGSGAIIPFDQAKGDITSYSEMVYGDDTALKVEEYAGESKNIYVPVYGIKCGENGIAAVITKGDATAKINADSASLSTSYTRVYSQYITSIVDSTTLFESNYENQRIINGAENRKNLGDFSVDYYFLHGSKANYSGMAEVYRNYLKLNKKAQSPKLMISVYGAAEKKASFLGIPYTKKIALTSFEDSVKMLKYFNDSGIPVGMQYIGWNNSGINNIKAASNYAPVSVLGGKKGIGKLLEYAVTGGNEVFLDNDFMLIKKSGNGFSAFSDVCKSVFNTRTPIYRFMLSVYVPANNENPSYLLTPENVEKASDKFLKKYKADAPLSLAGFGEKLYSDFSSDISREESKASFDKIMKKFSQKNMLAITGANAYTYKYTDTIFKLPLASDGNILFSESVPFVQMVLHGAVSYSADEGRDILDCIEYGASPYYYGISADAADLMETSYNWLYGSEFKNWREQAAECFKEYNSVYKDLYDKKITEHSRKDGVSKTVFENGTVIYVNRNGTAVTVDGITVEPNGYAVRGGR